MMVNEILQWMFMIFILWVALKINIRVNKVKFALAVDKVNAKDGMEGKK